MHSRKRQFGAIGLLAGLLAGTALIWPGKDAIASGISTFINPMTAADQLIGSAGNTGGAATALGLVNCAGGLTYSTSTHAFGCGSGGSGGGGIVTYSGTSFAPSGPSTLYFPIGGGASSSATETNVAVESPTAATVQNFYVQLSAAPGTGNSIVFTWRDNGASETLTCTIAGAAATTCNDTTDSFAAVQGDLVDIQAVISGTLSAGTLVMATEYGTSGGGGGGGGSTRGLFASRGTCTTAGTQYYSTDIPVISQCASSTWADWAFGYNVTLPSAASFTDVLSGATVTTNGLAFVQLPNTTNFYGEGIALPTPPYTAWLGLQCPWQVGSGPYCGLYVRDAATSQIVTFAFDGSNLQLAHFANYDPVGGGNQDADDSFSPGVYTHIYFVMHDDGTNFTFYWCNVRPGGYSTILTSGCETGAAYTESRTQNLTTPAFVGAFGWGHGISGSVGIATLFDWTVSQP